MTVCHHMPTPTFPSQYGYMRAVVPVCTKPPYLGITRPCRQVLPNASEETLQQLETNLAALPPISQLLQDGNSVADITAQILGPLGIQEESTTSITPRWACGRHMGNCTQALRGIGSCCKGLLRRPCSRLTVVPCCVAGSGLANPSR